LCIRNSDDGSNGLDIGYRRSCMVPIVMGTVGTPPGVPEMPTMMPGAMPPIGISTGVVISRVITKMSIWSGLGAQGAKGQDKPHHQDNAQPSIQVHSLTLPPEKICRQDLLIRRRPAGKR